MSFLLRAVGEKRTPALALAPNIVTDALLVYHVTYILSLSAFPLHSSLSFFGPFF